MKKRNRRKLNNAGSTLIIVLVMAAFMTVLGTVAITAAMVGYKMKIVDKEAKRTFYSAEEVVDEIYSGLGIMTMKKLEGAYLSVISSMTRQQTLAGITVNYQQTNREANASMRKKFTADMVWQLTGVGNWVDVSSLGDGKTDMMLNTYGDREQRETFLALVNSYIENPELAKAVSVDNITVSVTGNDTDFDKKFYTLRFKNCTVEYRTQNEADAEDTQTYYSRVTFDGVIDLDKYVNFSTDQPNALRAFENYSLVGCSGVAVDEGKNVQIYSGLYAGNASNNPSNRESSLTLNKSSSLSVTGANVIVKSQFALDSAKFKANSADIWCVDLITKGAGSEIDIDSDSNTYVLDDTEIGGTNNTVKISGSYSGYSYDGYQSASHSVTDGLSGHANSSAIIVNGSNSVLDLSGIRQLIIAGRAYIDYSTLTGKSATAMSGNSASAYLTGQSLALSGNQEVYLLPEIFMTEPGKDSEGRDINKTVYNPISAQKKIVLKVSDTQTVDLYTPAGTPSNVVTIDLNEKNFFGYRHLDTTTATSMFDIVKVTSDTNGTASLYVYFKFKNPLRNTTQAYYNDIFATLTPPAGATQQWLDSQKYMQDLLKANVSELSQSCILNTSDTNLKIYTNGSLISANSKTPAATVDNPATQGPAGAGNFVLESGKTLTVDNLGLTSINLNKRFELLYKTLLSLPFEKNVNGTNVPYILDEIPNQAIVDGYIVDLSAAIIAGNPFDNYVNTPYLESKCSGGPFTVASASDTLLVAAKTDVVVPASVTKGIIITQGDVVLNGNFSGLILAKGKITIKNNAVITNTATSVLLDANQAIRDFLLAYNPTSAPTITTGSNEMFGLAYTDLITLENWKKQSPTTSSTVLDTESESASE